MRWDVLARLLSSLDDLDSRPARWPRRHAAAVAMTARAVAAQMGLDAEACRLVHAAGPVHDVGQLLCSDHVVAGARGVLSDNDWMSVITHPEVGADLLNRLEMPDVAAVVAAHHERVDGHGYPRGLAGEEIPVTARIIHVAEIYDTLTAPGSYRTRCTEAQALKELYRVAGTQTDPSCVEALRLAVHRDAARPTGSPRRVFGEDANFEQEVKLARQAENRQRALSSS